MGSWHAIQRFTQAIKPTKDIISYQYIPAETKFTFANGETATVNWTLHLPTPRGRWYLRKQDQTGTGVYQFCQDLAHILLRHLQVKPLDNETS